MIQDTLVHCWELLTTEKILLPAGAELAIEMDPLGFIVYSYAPPTFHTPFQIPPYNVGGCL